MPNEWKRKTFAKCFHTDLCLRNHLFCFPFPARESVSQQCSSLHTHPFLIFNQSTLSTIHFNQSRVTIVPANRTSITTEIHRTVVQPNATSIMHWRKTCEIIYVVCPSVVCCLFRGAPNEWQSTSLPTYDASLKITRLLLTQVRPFRRAMSRCFRFFSFFHFQLHLQLFALDSIPHDFCWSIAAK